MREGHGARTLRPFHRRRRWRPTPAARGDQAASEQDEGQRSRGERCSPCGTTSAHVKGYPRPPFWNKGGVENQAEDPAGSGSASASGEKELRDSSMQSPFQIKKRVSP